MALAVLPSVSPSLSLVGDGTSVFGGVAIFVDWGICMLPDIEDGMFMLLRLRWCGFYFAISLILHCCPD